MDLNEAVKKLREKTGDSQQAFATRLRLSIRAIVNYEKDREPSPRALAAMARLAAEYHEYELANLLWSALPEELQTFPVLQMPPDAREGERSVILGMLSTPGSPLSEEGTEIALNDPRRILKRCVRDLDSLVSGASPLVLGAPAEKVRRVADDLTTVIKRFGQKVRVFPAKVEFKDLSHARGNKKTPE